MALAVPLIVMTLALLIAWGLGSLVAGRSLRLQQIVGALGVAMWFILPLAYDAAVFDGNCYGTANSPTPCTLQDRLTETFRDGFAFTLAPALMWVLVYIMALNSRGPTPQR